MKAFAKSLLKIDILCLFLITFPISTIGHAADRDSNVIIIFADDLGYGDVGVLNPESVNMFNLSPEEARNRLKDRAHGGDIYLEHSDADETIFVIQLPPCNDKSQSH